jgi:hypothetical protein
MKHRVTALLVAGSLACGTVAGAALASAAAQGSVVRYRVITKTFTVGQNQPSKLVDMKCPRGMQPVGGGAHYGQGSWLGGNPNGQGVTESSVDLSHHGWEISAFNLNGAALAFTGNVVCLVP